MDFTSLPPLPLKEICFFPPLFPDFLNRLIYGCLFKCCLVSNSATIFFYGQVIVQYFKEKVVLLVLIVTQKKNKFPLNEKQ